MHRVLLASLFHEGNSFSSIVTERRNFSITRGQAVLEKARNSGAAIGGTYRCLAGEDVIPVPVMTAIAPTGGPASGRVYEEFRDTIVSAAGDPCMDSIYLDLHGAMLTQSIDDVEADLPSHLRSTVGLDVPITVSLDLHAYMTPKMLAATALIVACNENPYSDYHLAGELAARVLVRELDGAIQPETAAVWLPLIFGSQMETSKGPLARLHARRRELISIHSELLDISIYNATSFMDVPDNGQCIKATENGNGLRAQQVVRELAELRWQERDEFTPDLLSLEDVLDGLKKGTSRKLNLGDQGRSACRGRVTSPVGRIFLQADNPRRCNRGHDRDQ